MNELAQHYPHASTVFVLTSTYGDGDAPSSASQFIAQLGNFQAENALKFVVLGFGDHQFPKFCQYALDVDSALSNKGLQRMHLLPVLIAAPPQNFATGARRSAYTWDSR